MKKKLSILLSMISCLLLMGCGNTEKTAENNVSTKTTETKEQVDLTISAAASLKESMADIETLFSEKYPNIKLTFNFGSSGSLQQQIEQGAPADVFISAGQTQMNALKDGSLMVDDTCKDLVKNRLVLVG